jgi:asparagine synthase (glutamine-hydrolysing)
MDIPYADSSFMPTFLLSQFATQSIKVALSGDGGDESFGGYSRYRINLILEQFNKFFPTSLFPSLMLKNRLRNKLYRSLKLKEFGVRYDSMMRLYTDDLISELFSEVRTSNSNSPAFNDILKSSKNLESMQRFDVLQYLPSDLLVKMDMASMANGLEVRSPFLDPELFEFGLSLKSRLKIKGSTGKYLARELLSEMLPRELFNRPKQGFAIPRAEWLRGPLRETTHDILLGSVTHNRGWFSQSFLRNVLKKHDSGWDLDELIWPVLMIEIWARNWIDA